MGWMGPGMIIKWAGICKRMMVCADGAGWGLVDGYYSPILRRVSVCMYCTDY